MHTSTNWLFQTKLVTDLQKKNRELDSALSQLEKTAENQLVRLAEQSELAMETAQTQLKISTAKLQEYNKFVKVFVLKFPLLVQEL